jgi:hypothetical protein
MNPTSRPPGPKLACRPFPAEDFLLPHVHLFDPASGVDLWGDLLVADGVVAALDERVDPPSGVECSRT